MYIVICLVKRVAISAIRVLSIQNSKRLAKVYPSQPGCCVFSIVHEAELVTNLQNSHSYI